jgi:hypothetical protein
MAKKTRRKKRRQIRLSAAQLAQPGATDAVDGGATLAPTEGKSLREEYGYVVADLKRMGIAAAAALTVVIVLVIVLV